MKTIIVGEHLETELNLDPNATSEQVRPVIERAKALIDAAPEMLEALLYVANDDGCPPDVATIVMAAIAKAMGGAE